MAMNELEALLLINDSLLKIATMLAILVGVLAAHGSWTGRK
jgi:hypothetical protein